MRKINMILAGALFLCTVEVQATDVINQDNKAYTIKVQGEGNLSISNHKVGPNGSVYGLCGYSFCSFEINGHKINAEKDAKLKIQNGKFVK